MGFRSERGPILIALMVSSGVIAIDSTILATAVPTIVKDIGGFAQFPWMFSVFLLAQAVTVPVYSKLADMIGRKRIILVGIAIFLLGSILCGFAWSMPALIVFRAIQGLGAGAVQPMAITIAGDIYTVAERARVQGYLASVWAISAVVGPALGGLFSQFLTWRYIFFVNIPICVLAGFLIVRSFHEKVERRPHKVDFAGALLLTVSMTLLILAVLEGGQEWAWYSWQSLGAFGLGGALLVAFLVVESRATEPIIPLWIFRRHLLVSTNILGLGLGALLTGVTSFVPTFLEGTLGIVPLVAGAAVAVLAIGWPFAASFSGRVYLSIGFKNTMVIGMSVAIAATALLASTAREPNAVVVTIACFALGFGMGFTASPAVVAAQVSVEWGERGVVTGTSMFARSIGSAVGVAIFGAIFASASGGEDSPLAVRDGSAAVFLAVAVTAAVSIVAIFTMPRTPAPRD